METKPPATKKQKVGDELLPQVVSVSSFDVDCGSSCMSSTPSLAESTVSDGAPSSAREEPQEPSNDETAPGKATLPEQVKHDIPKHLRTLATSTSLEEAKQAMTILYECLGSDAGNAALVAQQITSDLWFSSIVGCLARYQRSEEFSLLVITFLATLLFYEPKTAKLLVDLRATDTILHTAMLHPASELMSVNTVGLISNLACEPGDVRASVSCPKHVSFIADNMKWRPNNSSVQSAGCIYFKHITEEEGISKSLLEENDVIMSLGIAMKTFRCSNSDMYLCAKDAVKHIVS